MTTASRANPADQVCCYTSFSYSYLSRAQILARTVRAAHPDWAIHAVLVDKPPAGFDVAAGLVDFDRVIKAEALQIPRFNAWMFKHDVVEACTAVKGQMLVELLDAGFGKVVYLDPDIAVFHPLDAITRRLDDASIILTPHQCEPNETPMAVGDNELTSLQYGIYNLGFAAIRNDATGRAFARWWAAQLHRACYSAVEQGIFTDQKYCDLVPGLFDRVYVERDPGCNVASWNLSRRTLRFDGGSILVNGSPLKFYHFTKIGGAGDIMTERYAQENTEVFEVWKWYKRQLETTSVTGIPRRYWYYGHFSNGMPIPDAVRKFYRSREDLMGFFEDPFDVDGNSLYGWLEREAIDLLTSRPA
jgi:hypothetical protein